MRDYQSIEITNFRGPWTAMEDSDVPMEGARYAANVEYQPGAVKSRLGFSPVWTPNEPISSLFNWVKSADLLSVSGNWLFYVNPTTTTAKAVANLSSPSPLSLFIQAGMAAATFASGGMRTYIAPITTTGASAGQCRVVAVDPTLAVMNVDKAFLGPVTNTMTVTNSASAGVVTAGAHRLCYRILTRSGYLGPMCPVSGTTFAPDTVTATGGFQLDVAIASGVLSSAIAVTVDPATDTFTKTSHGLTEGTPIIFAAAVIPAGLIAGFTYYVRTVTTHTFQVTYAYLPGVVGPVVDVTTAGTTVTYQATTSGSTWPVEAKEVWIGMTTVANPNRWFAVPGAKATVTGGLPTTINLTINENDADLEAVGTDWSDAVNLWAQASGTGPFNPSVVLEINNRMGYIHVSAGVSQIAISEPENPQFITADQHVLTLPGQRQIVTGFMMPNGLYLVGPNWTYYTSDNGDKPVLWPSMTLIDGAIGTTAPRGVAANPSQGYAWVASTGGLYLFQGGAYPDKPASYYVSDWWDRINWNVAAQVEVKDQPHIQKVRVKVPLDGAILATHVFTFDYTQGTAPEVIAFSVDNITAVTNIGAIESVKNPTTGKMELWLANAAAGKVYRQMQPTDTNSHLDDAAAVAAVYETSLMPPKMNLNAVKTFHGAHFRVKGSGRLAITAYGLDRTRSVAVAPITLSSSPGTEPLRQWYLLSEAQSVRVSGGNWLLSVMKVFWKNWAPRR